MEETKQRSAQDALKDAAIKLILKNGFSGATLAPILAEAGLSKGAMFHHFASRDELMAAAYIQALSEAMELEKGLAQELRVGTLDLHGFLTEMVSNLSSGLFIVTMELAVAIRTRPAILEAADGFREWLDFRARYWQDLFDLPGRSDEQTDIHWDMLGYTLRGIGVRQMFGTETKNAERLAEALQLEFFQDAIVRPRPADAP